MTNFSEDDDFIDPFRFTPEWLPNVEAIFRPNKEMAEAVTRVTTGLVSESMAQALKNLQTPTIGSVAGLGGDGITASVSGSLRGIFGENMVPPGFFESAAGTYRGFFANEALLEASERITGRLGSQLRGMSYGEIAGMFDLSTSMPAVSENLGALTRLYELAYQWDLGEGDAVEPSMGSEVEGIVGELAADEGLMAVVLGSLQAATALAMNMVKAGGATACDFLSLEGNRALVVLFMQFIVGVTLPPPVGQAVAAGCGALGLLIISAYRRYVCGEEWQ